MKILLSYASQEDLNYLQEKDNHIKLEMLKKKITNQEIIIAKSNSEYLGWLRFSYLWDSLPFISLIFLPENKRKQGIGKKLLLFWEKEMHKAGHKLVITSTQADEEGQFFWRKMGYHDMGALFEINDGPAEIFFSKKI